MVHASTLAALILAAPGAGLQFGGLDRTRSRCRQQAMSTSVQSFPGLVLTKKQSSEQNYEEQQNKILEEAPCSAHARGYFSREENRPLMVIGRDVATCAEAAEVLGELNGRQRTVWTERASRDALDTDLILLSYETAVSEMMQGAAAFDDWSQSAQRDFGVRVLLNDGKLTDAMLTELREITQYEIPTYAAKNSQQIGHELRRLDALARRSTGDESEVGLDFGDDTFFLSLTYGDLINKATPDVLQEFDREVDMLEVRADLLDCIRSSALSAATNSFNSTNTDHEDAIRSQLKAGETTTALLEQLLALRGHLAESGRARHVPILFTARSRNQCGALADSAAAVYGLSALGLRAGVEWLDIEANWPALDRHAFVDWVRRRYPSTRILGSQHIVDEDHNIGQKAAVRLLHACHLGGRADAVKLVLAARDDRDSIALRSAAQGADLGATPRVAICLGDAGRLSRVLNRVMTPVTHAKLGGAAAPGQLDAKTLMALRRQLFLTKRAYHLVLPPSDDLSQKEQLGQDARSLLAAHQAAFDRVGLPHSVYIVENQEDTFDMAFGGAALLRPTPAKQIADVSPWAQAVGFVDTLAIFDRDDGRGYIIRGEHLMSSALANAVARYLDNIDTKFVSSERRSRHSRRSGFVLAADVTSEPTASALAAITALGLESKVVSQSSLAEAILELESPQDLAVLVIATSGTLNSVDLPESTLLVDLCQQDESSYQHPRILRKQDLLLEVALEQQRIWTHRRPPRADMAAAIKDTRTS